LAETVFVRKATGLVREVGLLSAILYCLTYSGQLMMPPTTIPYYFGWGNYTGNFWLGVLIALITTMLVNSVYAHFSSAMPRSGGDYVFLGRTMHPLLGFAPNWTWVWVASFWNGLNLLFFADIVRLFLSGFYPAETIASLSTPGASFGIGLVLWIVVLVMLVGGLKWFLRAQYVSWILQFITAGLVAAFFVWAAPSFASIFNSWASQYVPGQPDMYNKILSDAVAAGFPATPTPEGPAMERTLAFAAMAVGAAAPYTAGIIWIAGEVKRAESGVRQHVAMEVATILFYLMLILVGWTWVLAAGPRFLGAFNYLGSAVEGLPLSFFEWSWLPVVMPSWSVNFYIIAALSSLIIVYSAGILVVSRCLFAWSFDRMMPSFLAHVNDKYKSPTNAIFTASAISVILLALEVNINIWTYIGAAYFLVLVNMIIVSVAGLVFPYLRKDMFEQMPLKSRIAGVPVFSIISLLAIVFVGWTLTSFFTNPDLMASFGITQTMTITGVVIWVIGIVVYFIARAYNKSRGIDLDIAFRQIPPA